MQKSRFSTVYWWMWNGFLTWWSNIHPWQTRAMCMTTNVFVYVIPNLYELILLNIFNPVPVYFIFFIFFGGYYEYPVHKIKNLTFFGFFKYFLFQNHNYKHVQTNTYDAITQVFKSSYTGQTWTLLILTILTMHEINITVCFFISNGQHKVETQHNLISQLKNTHKILY